MSAAEVWLEEGGLEHLAEVLALSEATPDAPHWTEAVWTSFLQTDEVATGAPRGKLLLLARASDRNVVGWLAASSLFEETELESLLVRTQWRGKGLARQLMERWLGWAGERGAAEAILEVRASNRTASRLYRALGFQEQGRRVQYYAAPQEDAVLMTRSVR